MNCVTMWDQSSQNCERNCQCSGLITENFKINSGNSATKRKQEDSLTHNYKLKMNPHTIDFTKSPSPIYTPGKRRILGELQLANSPLDRITPKSLMDRTMNSPVFNSPLQRHSNISNSPIFTTSLQKKSPVFNTSLQRNLSTISNSPLLNSSLNRSSPVITNSPVFNCPLQRNSPLTSRSKRSKLSRVFEDRSRFKANKENERLSESLVRETRLGETLLSESRLCESLVSETRLGETRLGETLVKFGMEEETRDFSFGFETERKDNWSATKLDFTDALQKPQPEELYVPEKEMSHDDDLETLLDLEQEFDADNFDQCSNYEIISTDSPNIIQRGRTTCSRKVSSRNFVFGAPLADHEPSTSFNRPNNATRMLNFDDEDFEFTSPALKKSNSVKKSLKFTETPLKHEKSDSSIGSMSSSPPKVRLFTSESTTSMESGFISEFEEPFLEIEESNSPKVENFSELLSGTIKSNVITDKNFMRRPLNRSLSFNPEPKPTISLFSILESPGKKGVNKRSEDSELVSNKRRKLSPEKRPILHRAFSENNASIMSALARSAVEPDLIGDFSQPFALPLTSGNHSDLKSISCDTLAGLLRGEFEDTISDYQVIDCRYPYEYEGGHILHAINYYTPTQILSLVSKPLEQRCPEDKRTILVFHCEFSLERGPKLSRFLRSSDREQNKENYPSLHYPEVYLLHEGYRSFYQRYPELCSPAGYTAMLDPQHRQQLRRHRSVNQPSTSVSHRRNRLLF